MVNLLPGFWCRLMARTIVPRRWIVLGFRGVRDQLRRSCGSVVDAVSLSEEATCWLSAWRDIINHPVIVIEVMAKSVINRCDATIATP